MWACKETGKRYSRVRAGGERLGRRHGRGGSWADGAQFWLHQILNVHVVHPGATDILDSVQALELPHKQKPPSLKKPPAVACTTPAIWCCSTPSTAGCLGLDCEAVLCWYCYTLTFTSLTLIVLPFHPFSITTALQHLSTCFSRSTDFIQFSTFVYFLFC